MLEPRGRPSEWVGCVQESLEGTREAGVLGRGARGVDRVIDANPVVGVAVGESALQGDPASNRMLKRRWGTNRRLDELVEAGGVEFAGRRRDRVPGRTS